MTPDQARAELRRIAQAREDEPAAIVNALKAGVRVTDVAQDVGRTREHVRRIARANNIDPR